MIEAKIEGTKIKVSKNGSLSANNGVIYIYSDKGYLLDVYEVGNVKDSVNIFALRCNSVRTNDNEKLQSKNWYKKYKKYVTLSKIFNIKVLESDILGVDKNNSRIMEIFSHRTECKKLTEKIGKAKENSLEGYNKWTPDLKRVSKLSGVAQVTIDGKTVGAVLGNDVIDECQKIIRGMVLAYIGDETSDFYKKMATISQNKEIEFYIKEIPQSINRYREFELIDAPIKKNYEGFNKYITKKK